MIPGKRAFDNSPSKVRRSSDKRLKDQYDLDSDSESDSGHGAAAMPPPRRLPSTTQKSATRTEGVTLATGFIIPRASKGPWRTLVGVPTSLRAAASAVVASISPQKTPSLVSDEEEEEEDGTDNSVIDLTGSDEVCSQKRQPNFDDLEDELAAKKRRIEPESLPSESEDDSEDDPERISSQLEAEAEHAIASLKIAQRTLQNFQNTVKRSDGGKEDDEADDELDAFFGGPAGVYAQSQAEVLGEDEDSEPAVQPTQVRPSPSRSAYESTSSKLIDAFNMSTYALLQVVLEIKGMPCDGWISKRKSNREEWKAVVFTLWLMLQSWDPLILKHFVHGDIAKAETLDQQLHRKLKRMANIVNVATDNACPSTYAQYLVHETTGESPSVGILLQIMDDVELYTKGLGGGDAVSNELARRVESLVGNSSRWDRASACKGERRYIKASQQKVCEQWVANVRERLSGLPTNHIPARPLAEIGYATHPEKRLKQHSSHNSSNYLMNLADAICRLKYNSYVIKQYVVHHLVHAAHAMYDEIIASRIALTYTSHGGGFCHFQAGVSNQGTKKLPTTYYRDMQERLMEDQDFVDRVAAGIDQIGEFAAERTRQLNNMLSLKREFRVLLEKRLQQEKLLEGYLVKRKQETEGQETMDLWTSRIEIFIEDEDVDDTQALTDNASI